MIFSIVIEPSTCSWSKRFLRQSDGVLVFASMSAGDFLWREAILPLSEVVFVY